MTLSSNSDSKCLCSLDKDKPFYLGPWDCWWNLWEKNWLCQHQRCLVPYQWLPSPRFEFAITRLDIRAPTEREHLFLKEYFLFWNPLTIALDMLQGDSYYSALLRALETLMSRTLALQTGLSRMTADLLGVIVQVRQFNNTWMCRLGH